MRRSNQIGDHHRIVEERAALKHGMQRGGRKRLHDGQELDFGRVDVPADVGMSAGKEQRRLLDHIGSCPAKVEEGETRDFPCGEREVAVNFDGD